MIKIIPVIAIFLSGCASTPTGNIEVFGLAAADVTNKIDAVLSDYNAANINDKLVIMAQSRKKYVTSDFDPIKEIIIRDADKNNFALYKANNALGSYAKSLSALAGAGSRDELAIAGVKLSKSLKGMNEQYQTLTETKNNLISDENSGRVSRVIAELSTYYTEQKRGKALKEIIIAADPSIQSIGKIINEQLLKGVIESRLYTMRGNELAGYFDDYNSTASKSSFSSKKKMLDEIYKRYIKMESTTATIMQARKAILSVMRAHGELKKELEKDRFDSKEILQALGNIKTINKNLGDLEELMKNCKTEIISDEEKGIICKETAASS